MEGESFKEYSETAIVGRKKELDEIMLRGGGVRDPLKINPATLLCWRMSIGYLEPLVLFNVTLVHANLCTFMR